MLFFYLFIFPFKNTYGAPSIEWKMPIYNDIQKAQFLSSRSEQYSEGHREVKRYYNIFEKSNC